MIIILIIIPVITISASQKVVDSIEDIDSSYLNVTTLYPVANITLNKNVTKPTKEKPIINATAWKIEAAFAESNVKEEKNKTESETTTEVDSNTTTESTKEQKNVSSISEFKPSQHLGTYFDVSEEETPKLKTFGSFSPVIKKPAAGFVSSPKDLSHIINNIPKEIYKTHKEFPYKFEEIIYTKAREPWRHADSLESKPTAQVPVRVPAGGFYKSPDAFKETPGLYDDDEYFGMELHDAKEHPLKKRTNPWQSLLRLVTAFIPVGLIISALTPSIITVQSGPDNHYPSTVYRRRSDSHISELAPISERCRRRLLCELHSETTYIQSQRHRHTRAGAGKQCYKLHCEDTQALSRMLRWLLTYHQPGAGDQRGRHFT